MMIGVGTTTGESDGSTMGAPGGEDVGATDGTVFGTDDDVGAEVIMGAGLTIGGSDVVRVGAAEMVVFPNI